MAGPRAVLPTGAVTPARMFSVLRLSDTIDSGNIAPAKDTLKLVSILTAANWGQGAGGAVRFAG